MRLTLQRRQRLDFTALLVDVEARAHLASILFDERPGEVYAFGDGRRWWSVIVVNRRWGRCDRDAWW